jgi:murein DD-endopeptidase MepM/ murein hydrolase activator NlpD
MQMKHGKTRHSTRGAAAVVALGGFIVLILLIAFTLTFKRWEGQPPRVMFDHDFTSLGRSPSLSLTVEDPETGLRHVSIRLKQKDQDIVLAEESFDRKQPANTKIYDVGKLLAEKYKAQAGPATLTVAADDYALRNFLKGNRTELSKDFVFHVQPPKLEVISGQHYINQGGSECVVYRVSDDAETSGVQVGTHFFPGYPVEGQKDLRFALFALEYDWPADTPMMVVARDGAGNEVTAEFWHKVFPKKFRSRDLALEDSFVQKVVPEIMAHTHDIKDQDDPVKTFVEINSTLRRMNHETIAKWAKQSPGQFLWNGPFLQLSNSKVEAFFADRRTYVYNGKAVDTQDHVGFDLSVVQHNPIQAANDGKVVLAEFFGIYGNAVLIDHGAGLLSLYGHMSQIDVKPGQMVKKREVLGKSGMTGLAAGDHLHFGMFLQGVPVNPTEWWDEKWIKDHVLDRLKSADNR